MKRYFDTVLNRAGAAIEGAEVRVLDGDGNEVQLYSDDGISTTDNPVLTDENGLFSFFVADGTYTLEISYGSFSLSLEQVEIFDDSEERATTERAVIVPDGESGVTLPAIAVRAGKFMVFDAGGAPTVSDGTGSDGTLRTDLASSASGKGAGLLGVSHDAIYAAGTLGAGIRFVSVKDHPFLAAGDDATDEIAACQAAADYIESIGGGILFFPPGTYQFKKSLEIASNTTILGCGRATVIKARVPYIGVNGGTNGSQDCQLIKNKNYDVSTLTDHDITVQNLHIDWNGVTISGGGAHSISMRYVDRVTVRDVTQEGGENVTAFLACQDTLTENCYGHNVTNCGFDHWDGSGSVIVRDCTVRNDSGVYGHQGVQVTGTGSYDENRTSSNALIAGCKIFGVRSAAGQGSSININAGASGVSGVNRAKTEFNHIEDSDIGLSYVGGPGGHISLCDTFVNVDQLPISMLADGTNYPKNCRIIKPHLIDCSHAVASTAMISVAGTSNLITDVKVTNTTSAAYTRIAWLTSNATNCKVTIESAPDGSTGLRFQNDSTTSEIVDYIAPAFLARDAAGQTFSSGTATDMTWDTESYDKGGNFASPTFTAPVKGRYKFDYCITHDATGTAGDRWAVLLIPSINTNSFRESYKMIADYNSIKGGGTFELSAGETVKVRIQRASGSGNLVTLNDANYNWFSGVRVS